MPGDSFDGVTRFFLPNFKKSPKKTLEEAPD